MRFELQNSHTLFSFGPSKMDGRFINSNRLFSNGVVQRVHSSQNDLPIPKADRFTSLGDVRSHDKFVQAVGSSTFEAFRLEYFRSDRFLRIQSSCEEFVFDETYTQRIGYLIDQRLSYCLCHTAYLFELHFVSSLTAGRRLREQQRAQQPARLRFRWTYRLRLLLPYRNEQVRSLPS